MTMELPNVIVFFIYSWAFYMICLAVSTIFDTIISMERHRMHLKKDKALLEA